MPSIRVFVATVVLLAGTALAQPRPATAPATRGGGGGGAAAVDPVPTTGKVVAVTVYQGTALVTREVDVRDGQGLVEVVVSPLPPQTVDSSLYTEGGDGIRVLSTRYRTRAVREDTREEVRRLQQQSQQLEEQARSIEREAEVVQKNVAMLAKLENFTASTMSQLTDKGMLNADSTVKLATFVMDTRAEQAKRAVALEASARANAEQAQFVRRQLGELTAGASRTERDAVIVVDKANAAAGRVRLNYLVGAATWRPQYKLRAPANANAAPAADGRAAVALEYLAEITQQSGEDWSGVGVTLSTAEPMLNAAPPELAALDVTVSGGRVATARGPTTQPMLGRDNYEARQSLRRLAQREFNANGVLLGNQLNNDAAALEQTFELLSKEEDVAQSLDAGEVVPREGPSVTYHLGQRLTIPSRNDPQLIEVARLDLAPEYFHKVVPVLSRHVYRLAVLTNTSAFVLLPGESTMYLGSDFVGRMNIPLVAIGEQFTVGFGVDPQVQVARELVGKTRSFQGGNQVQTYAYRIRVSSFKPGNVRLQVWDRLPRGDVEAVGVQLVRTAPDLTADPAYQRAERPKNLLRWDLDVKPGSTGEKASQIEYEFKMEYARDVSIGNFKAAK